jgi:predicted metalloprotease with PDZ domain
MARLPIQPLNGGFLASRHAPGGGRSASRRGVLAAVLMAAIAIGGGPAAGPSAARAQGEPQTRSAHTAHSAPIAGVRYDVTLDSATNRSRTLDVAMHFTVGGAGPVVLGLPAWSPGHYVLLWFARRVSHFTPTMDGAPLSWHQLDFQTWELEGTKPGANVTVDFKYLADTIDRAVAWTRPDFGFFNGTNVFMYPVGRGFDWPAQVTIHTDPGWNIATGMHEMAPGTAAAGGPGAGARTFAAQNYHDLVDMPFFIGHFDFDSVEVKGPAGGGGGAATHWVRAASYPAGLVTGARMTRLLDWLHRLAETHAKVFRDMEWGTYTVLQIIDAHPNGGGLEHQNSQVDEFSPAAIDATGLSGLYSHEMFHSWNVKRLRPADMVPYRYDDAEPTGWLWVSEGFTDYYADLDVMRSGIADSLGFLAATGQKITGVGTVVPTGLADASLGAWVAPTDGSAGLYYPKGSLAGFMLDVLIRDASDNHHSLDDAMRSLYETTYKQGRGFTAAEWWAAMAAAARPGTPAVPFDEVNRRYIEGRDPYPWDVVLARAGLRMTTDTVKTMQVGAGISSDANGALTVTFVVPAGAAAAAGVQAGDRLVRLGDVEAHGDSSLVSFRRRYASATGSVPVVISRGGQEMTVQVAIQSRTDIVAHLSADPGAPAKAARVRHGLFMGTTE